MVSLRRILFIPLLVSAGIFLFFSPTIITDLGKLFNTEVNHSSFLPLLVVAISLQIIGHILRAVKTRYIMQPVAATSTGTQFRALSIGYLFNTLLPLKLGELIRTQVVAANYSLSYGTTLVVIIIERMIDVFIVSLLGLLLVAARILPTLVLGYLTVPLLVAIIIMVFLLAIVFERPSITNKVYQFSQWFNPSVKVKIQFKYWSIYYGLREMLAPKMLVRYILLSIGMWAVYFASVGVFLFALGTGMVHGAQVVSPFYSLSAPLGPASLGTYSDFYTSFTSNLPTDSIKNLALSTWMFLIIPMCMIGLGSLSTLRVPAWRKFSDEVAEDAYDDKLSRKSDISGELSLFLENYLKGNSLSKIVNRLERKKEFRLLRYFKGGSDAITILVRKNKTLKVQKIIAIELKDRLKAQYDWLRSYRDKNIVVAVDENTSPDYYSIDLEYDKNNEMFFDYMHRASLNDSIGVIDVVWDALNRTVHRDTKNVHNTKEIIKYIDQHFYGCLEKASMVSDDLRNASQPEEIDINGGRMHNAFKIMELIKKNKKIMNDLASYASSGAVHGDVAVDNILVNAATKHVTLIDPAPDGNIVNGRVFDFGKNMQSLYCGYEFILRSSEPSVLHPDGSITYKDQKSMRYTELCEYVQNDLAPKYLTDAEQKAILFHAGVLLIRRLKHQVYQDPRLTLAIYGAGVKTLNDFYDLYDR